jgi:hypothetical protein
MEGAIQFTLIARPLSGPGFPHEAHVALMRLAALANRYYQAILCSTVRVNHTLAKVEVDANLGLFGGFLIPGHLPLFV